MTSKRMTRRPAGNGRVSMPPPSMKVAPRSAMSQSSVVIAVSAILQASARYAEAAPPTTPPLPTPCKPCNLINPSKILPFVQSGTAGASVAGNSLQINQTSNSAILNWQDFNIANGYSVNFKQPSTTSATLNRIWSGSPSTIAGQLTANGQVYLINQNGIVFANGAQVNVGGLVASTLDVADTTFLNGLLAGNSSTISPGNASVLPPVFQDTSGSAKGVSVAAGASLTAADRGRIMLLGTTVTNQGSISTPDGQTILGAGNTVYLASSTDPAMRGLLIAVDGQQVAANSTVTNEGQISAARGNVTLAGLVVNQAGTISATTSVNANGSIYLLAGNAANASTGATLPFYNDAALTESDGRMLPNQGGTLTLAPGSVTQVRADSTDTGSITDSQAFSRSQINLVGQTVTLQGNAAVVAPSGQVDVVASSNPFHYVQDVDINQVPTDDSGRIYLDSASVIDVSGLTDVAISASRNLIQIQLDANALQDDPLLRDSFLHGAKVTVDLGRGTPLLNQATLNAYAATIGRGIDEKLTQGGTINLTSGGDVITRAGSIQNVSGGSVAYRQSAGADTKLLGADGKVYDLSTAPNNIQYVGFADSYSYTDTRWGVTSSWSQKGGLIPSYVDGASAGTISVQAPQAYLLGSMQATTTPGLFQRSASTLPKGGTFVLGDSGAVPSSTAGALTNYAAPSVMLVNVVEDDLGAFIPVGTDASVLPANDRGTTALSLPALGAAGFNNFGIYSNGTITVAAGSNVSLPGNGSLTLRAGSVLIAGAIRAPGSAVNISTATNLAQGNLTKPPASDNNIVLGPGASIDVSGTWVNDSPLVTTLPGTAPTLFNGGSVSLQTAAEPSGTSIPHNDIVLGPGSLIDVSGGGWVSSQNNLTPGTAGSIGLQVGPVSGAPATGGVELGGTLRGESLSSGGSLSITSAWASIAGDVGGEQGELSISPGFFTQNGFSKYSITGINGLTIGSGNPSVKTTISPLQQNLVFTQNMLLQPTGSNLSGFTTLETLPDYQRGAASVTFASTASSQATPGLGNVTLNSGVRIVTDPGASVTLTARENLTVSGEIDAPAGAINLQLAPGIATNTTSDNDGYVPSQQLLITSGAQLLARGYDAIYTDSNSLGYRLGQVLPGGTITVAANKGSVVAQSGSVIDVSGASGVVDVVNAAGVTPTTVAGAAGSIDVEARENLVLNSTLKGSAAPVAGAAGGTLTVGLDLFDLNSTTQYDTPGSNNGPAYPTGSRTLTLTSATRLSNSLPVDQNGNSLDGVGTIGIGTIAAGGFDNVTLRSSDIIRFDGTVALNAKSSVTVDALELTATPGARATVGAAYVALGDSQYFLPGSGESARSYTPVAGNALLVASADLIDIRGNSVLDGFQTATFNSKGDIRFTYATDANGQTDFTGSLASAANLTFVAAQLYPTTQTQFTINPMRAAAGAPAPVDPTQAASYGYSPGSVTIVANSAAAAATVPLSALGSLTIDAPSIDQGGVLRAPFGQIALNGIGAHSVVTLHPGSLTSVSADGQTVPYGSTQNGTQWTYTVDNSTQSIALVDSLPGKEVSLNGNQVSIDSNAKVDLSGSGDLYAYEFVAGTGGSKDVLAAGGSYSYAILPTLGSQYAPIDYQYNFGAGANIPVGKEIYLQGVPGIANGYYALLPARYALLPGAYGIRLATGSSDIVAGSAAQQPDGSYLAAGRFAVAGTDTIDSRTSTFDIVPSSVIRTESQYQDSFANTFFNAAAVAAKSNPANLPADAGQLQLSSSGSMQLDGTILFAPSQFVVGKDASGNNIVQQGSGGIASIQAPQIEVVEPNAVPDGSLQVSASSLNALGAATLILGGTASVGVTGENLSVVASTVKLENSAADPLKGPEIILAATQQVQLASGSSIMATGSASPSVLALNVQGDGALLRVSSGQQETVLRTNVPTGPQGLLSIDSGATISATSLALDAAGNSQVDPTAIITAQAVEASSSRISIGAVPTGTSGLNVTSQLLSNFTGLTDLELHSDSSIDFYGAVQLGSLDSTGRPILRAVTLDAGGIAGYGGGAKTIQAGTITVSNVGNTPSPPSYNTTPNGTGALTLSALATGKSGSGQLNLGVGAKDVEGFGSVTLVAADDIRGLQGTGSLSLTNAGMLNLQSARISMDAGAEQDIANLSSGVSIAATTRVGTAPDAGLGGKLTISGTAAAGQTAVAQNGIIDMPAGVVVLQAHGGGDLTLGSGSQIIATGVAQPFADTYATAPGGTVQLGSDSGNVTLASGAIVDVSGVTAADGKTSSDAGSLTVLVPMGQFNQGGTLKGGAAAGQNQGNFTLDTAGNGIPGAPFDVSALNLSADGFTGAVSIRDRGDAFVLVSGNVRASSFELSADQGNISVAGTIDTSGTGANASGGAISLWALGSLTLDPSAVLNASAIKPANGASARAGDITLGATNGLITLSSGSTVNIKGQSGSDNLGVNPDGTLLLRAAYNPTSGTVNVAPIGATIISSQFDNKPPTVVVEGVQSYSASSIGTGGVLTYTTLDSGIQSFAANASAIESNLTPTTADFTVQARPGIDISSGGDLTVKSTLDLNGMATGYDSGVPIDLTLRAAGNLILSGSISDGFVKTASPSPTAWTLASGQSGNLTLTAGADLGAVNPLSTKQDTGSFILTPGNLVRTGTGNIDIAAGNDICLGCNTNDTVSTLPTAQASVIYTAGQQSTNGPTYFTAPKITGTTDTPAAYPVGGGNIDIRAGNDVVSAPTTNLISNWLWRQGSTAAGQQKNTSWWIEFSRFQEGVGAFGGGAVSVQAGGDITDLSVVVPTTGRVGSASATDNTLLATALVVDGGGNLSVRAGGNISSGLFEDDLGKATLNAGGAIQADPSWGIAPLLSLADTTFEVNARANATLAGVYNSTAVSESKVNSSLSKPPQSSYFYTYEAASAVDITSAGGDVALTNDIVNVLNAAKSGSLLDTNYIDNALYPPTLNVAALSGNIALSALNQTQLFPAADGNLNLLAQGNVTLPTALQMLQVDPTLFDTVLNPASAHNFALQAVPLPNTPLHQTDPQPARIVAVTGDIDGSPNGIAIPKQAELVAGRNIKDVTYTGENLHPSDVTLFEAGGSILYTPALNALNQLGSNSTGIQLGGPGYLELLAGSGINLANSKGVITSGDLNDVRLASGGATLITAAGLGTNADGTLRAPAYDAFISTYLEPDSAGNSSQYAGQLLAYMEKLYPEQTGLTQAQALADFLALPRTLQLPLVSQVLSAELNATGLAHTRQGTTYDRGYNAIATLFPTKDASGNPLTYSGDINMFYSQLKTEQGGDINLLVPGGSVVVGVPNPDPNLALSKQDASFNPPLSAEANLGLLILGSGGIYGFADQNFEVNQSRILTLQGGDIILWSSNGNIDAGKGARTASGAPPPVIETDPKGNVYVNPVGAVTGSGIGQLLTIPGITAGQVDLIAPRGAVNAGEAGIRAVNLNIAALQVLNVGNIKVSGTATGLPASDSGAFAGALSGANALGDAGKNVADQLAQNLSGSSFQQLTDDLKPTFIVVKMFCLGVQCDTQ